MGKKSFQANGKLLLTSEYGVLDGALALAIPTTFCQRMEVKQTRKSDLFWKSYDHEDNMWFSAQISLYDFSSVKTTDDKKALYLKKLLRGAVRLNSEFLSKWNGFDVNTYLNFDKAWGLGSSSSLTYLVAQWAQVNPLLLHFECFKGSGYDVACAGAEMPITYQLGEESVHYEEIEFNPGFTNQLYFVYRNQKQDSKAAVDHYFKKAKQKKTLVKKLSELTEQFMSCTKLSQFQQLMVTHEKTIAEHLGLEPVALELGLEDFNGAIKSLGAWGGDFILAATDMGDDEVRAYFKVKGLSTVVNYADMIFSQKAALETV